jgi:hypothetical protein
VLHRERGVVLEHGGLDREPPNEVTNEILVPPELKIAWIPDLQHECDAIFLVPVGYTCL